MVFARNRRRCARGRTDGATCPQPTWDGFPRVDALSAQPDGAARAQRVSLTRSAANVTPAGTSNTSVPVTEPPDLIQAGSAATPTATASTCPASGPLAVA